MSTAIALEAAVIGYVVLRHVTALALIGAGVPQLRRGRESLRDAALPPVHPSLEPPVSVLVVAADEADTIVERVSALLALDYPEHEVVVVNDGSADGTLDALVAAFGLETFPEAHWRRLQSPPVRAIFRSHADPRLRVLDQEMGGDAAALNSAVNASRFPLLCIPDRETSLRPDALHRLAEPFIDAPATVATQAPANVTGADPGFDPRRLARPVAALREFLVGLGGLHAGALLHLPRGVLAMRKDAVIEARGWQAEVEGAVDLLARLQPIALREARGAGIRFIPEPVCHDVENAASESLLASARREHRELVGAFHRHAGALFRAGGALRGVMAVALLACAIAAPALDLLALAAMAACWLTGGLPGVAFAAFLAMAVALGALVSATAVAVEAAYPMRLPASWRFGPIAAMAVLENLGPRHAAALARCTGLFEGLREALRRALSLP